MTLSELGLGDRFYPKSKAEKKTPIWTVTGECEFNIGHGSATRKCRNEATGETNNKSCRMEVIKLKPRIL